MDLLYKRPNMKEVETKYNELLKNFNQVKTLDEQTTIIEEINQIRDHFLSMYWLAFINYTCDTTNEEYLAEQMFFSEAEPLMDQYKLKYFKCLLESPWKKELTKILGSKVFQLAESEICLLNPNIIEDLTKDNQLGMQYMNTLMSITQEYEGNELTLMDFMPYGNHPDRNVRKSAHAAKTKMFEKIETTIDDILDEMIKTRNNIAKTLGYKSYSEVSYIKLKRLNYGKKELETFKKQVVKYVVPYVCKLKEKQKENLGLDTLMNYDEAILFNDGNASYNGNEDWVLEQLQKIYQDINPELSNFLKKMVNEKYLDIKARPNKEQESITCYLPDKKMPFVITNFFNISHDIQAITHELGHAFQLYSSKDLKYFENWWPSFDACEIHSISMELLTLPYMEYIFKEDANKYRYEELLTQLTTTCNSCLIDEFQHLLYDQPDLTKEQRKEQYRALEKQYMPWLTYDEDYLNRGNSFQKLPHIFTDPFYYIDYGLAICIALQFYKLSLDNKEDTWEKYINCCKQGGTNSFIDSIKKEGLKTPFDEDMLKEIIESLPKF